MNDTKEKPAFTPGPWVKASIGIGTTAKQVVWLGENTDKRVQVIGTGRDHANARLIASAPEMLDALKNVKRALGMPVSLEAIRLLVDEAIHKAEAKVEGGEG